MVERYHGTSKDPLNARSILMPRTQKSDRGYNVFTQYIQTDSSWKCMRCNETSRLVSVTVQREIDCRPQNNPWTLQFSGALACKDCS